MKTTILITAALVALPAAPALAGGIVAEPTTEASEFLGHIEMRAKFILEGFSGKAKGKKVRLWADWQGGYKKKAKPGKYRITELTYYSSSTHDATPATDRQVVQVKKKRNGGFRFNYEVRPCLGVNCERRTVPGQAPSPYWSPSMVEYGFERGSR